jgi:hypothetical protein
MNLIIISYAYLYNIYMDPIKRLRNLFFLFLFVLFRVLLPFNGE